LTILLQFFGLPALPLGTGPCSLPLLHKFVAGYGITMYLLHLGTLCLFFRILAM
jgi:hypothetical protein